ncbi:hypothetical protein [Frondihabitans sp. PAMC 28766]|uniref:hypothetical protein n=1 Tax=Frondihabitans sp. PAMC 28766 TaxID=1795630 RepID=UPI0012FFA0CF|nr:hypothetical protein [Frondihabitans sp. PAMC 28766]
MKSATLLSSSVSATDPALQLLVGFDVVAENAEYDAVPTTMPEASRAVGIAIQAAILARKG